MATAEVVGREGAICSMMAAQTGRAQEWLAGCQQFPELSGGSDGGGAAGVDLHSGAVFSSLDWEGPCDGDVVFSAPIEPLVGHFR